MPYKNREDQLAAQRRHYKKNPNYYVIRNKAAREVRRQFLVKYKSDKFCSECGESHIACLDFHHTKKDKEGQLGREYKGWSIARILREIEKCIVLCSNCHRKLHWRERTGAP